MPTSAMLGPASARSASTSAPSSASASGMCGVLGIEIILQNDLRGDGIDLLLAGLPFQSLFREARIGFAGGVALVDQRHGQTETAFHLPRETTAARRHFMFAAIGRTRQA